jgi:hypothetical protein
LRPTLPRLALLRLAELRFGAPRFAEARFPVLLRAVLCFAVLFLAVLFRVVLLRPVLFFAVLFFAVPFLAVLWRAVLFFAGLLRAVLLRALPLRFFAVVRLRPPVFFALDRFAPVRLLGTLAPFSRASESPMAIACLRLLTAPPLPPLPRFSVPLLRRRIVLSTLLPAAFPYLRPPLFFVAIPCTPIEGSGMDVSDRGVRRSNF